MQLIPLLSLAATITAIFAQPVMLKVARDVPTKQAEANANDQSDPGLAVDRIALVGGGGVAGWMGYEILEKLFKGMRNKGAAKPRRHFLLPSLCFKDWQQTQEGLTDLPSEEFQRRK